MTEAYIETELRRRLRESRNERRILRKRLDGSRDLRIRSDDLVERLIFSNVILSSVILIGGLIVYFTR